MISPTPVNQCPVAFGRSAICGGQTVRGFAGDRMIRKHEKELISNLKLGNIGALGSFRFLGYNPPWRLFGRLNEVMIGVPSSAVPVNQ